MNKILMISLIGIFAVGFVVAAGYVVNRLTLTVGVAEPFVVSYAVLGDAGDWDGTECSALPEDDPQWFASDNLNIPTGNFFPMESRNVCVRIQNLGEANIPYTITSTVINDNLDKDCENAFGNHLLNGDATALQFTDNGVVVQIAANATPVEGCSVLIETARG